MKVFSVPPNSRPYLADFLRAELASLGGTNLRLRTSAHAATLTAEFKDHAAATCILQPETFSVSGNKAAISYFASHPLFAPWP